MLSSVHGRNFLSWKNLDFVIPKGVTLIDGWNEDDDTAEGSGKSAVLNLICWTAFGKLPKDVNVDEVIKFGEKTCGGELHFDDGVKIFRTRKPNELGMFNAQGVLIKGKDAKETQQLIEEYLNVTFDSYCQSTYFAQNYNKKFLSCNQEEKGKVISEIQNILIFDKARKETNDRLKIENDKILGLEHTHRLETSKHQSLYEQGNLLNSFIEEKEKGYKAQVEIAVRKQNSQLEMVSQAENARDQAINELLAIGSEDDVKKGIEELTSVRPEYANQLAEINHQISQVDVVVKSIIDKEFELQRETIRFKALQDKIVKIEQTKDSDVLRLTNEKQKLKFIGDDPKMIRIIEKIKTLEAYIKNPTKSCPSCGSELKNPNVSHAHSEIESLVSEYNVTIEEAAVKLIQIDTDVKTSQERALNETSNTSSEMDEIISKLEAGARFLDENPVPVIDELKSKKIEILSVISQIDSAIKQSQEVLNSRIRLEANVTAKSQNVKTQRETLDHYAKELMLLKEPDITQELAKLKKIDGEFETVSLNIKTASDNLKIAKTQAIRLEQLKEGYKEIKSYIFANALNELSYKSNKYLEALFEVSAKVKFYNEDFKIEVKLILDGQETSIGLLSGGQFRRFSLAIDLSLADMVRSRKSSVFDLLQLDEYFKDLHESSMEKCLELLKAWKSPVLIVEHNSLFKNIVDKTFFVKFENGTSHAAEG